MLPKLRTARLADEEVMDVDLTTISGMTSTLTSAPAPSRSRRLVEQLGLMRFGHRPRVADTFCGSGQNPFRGGSARLRCVCLRLEPGRLHAHLGCIHIVGGICGRAVTLAQEQERTGVAGAVKWIRARR